jgi:peptide/nickel transport system substrate-binding protein
LIIDDYADESSQVNALVGGQVDAAMLVPATSIAQLTSAGREVTVSPGGGWIPFVMRVDTPPFHDSRVRQALKLVVDRPQMIDVAFAGHGTLGNDIPGIWAPEYDASIPQRHQDIEQAKSLLKAAGQENLNIQLVVPTGLNQGIVESAQVFAQNASAAGVKVALRQISVGDFYNGLLKWPFTQDFWYYDLYFPSVALNMLPSSPYNETHFDNPTYTNLYQQALATVDVGARTSIAHEMQRIEYAESGYIIPYFAPTIDAYASNVKGVVPSKTGASFNGYNFKDMWLS